MRSNCKPRASKDFFAANEVFETLQVFILKKKNPVLNWQLYWQNTQILRLLPSSRRLEGWIQLSWRMAAEQRLPMTEELDDAWNRQWSKLDQKLGNYYISTAKEGCKALDSSKNMYVWWACLRLDRARPIFWRSFWSVKVNCLTFPPHFEVLHFQEGFHPDAFWQMKVDAEIQRPFFSIEHEVSLHS